MNRKLIFLTSLVVLLSCFSAANAGFEIKVDLTVNAGGPVDWTDKSQQDGFADWYPWVRWSGDKEGHDASRYNVAEGDDISGEGVSIGLGMWNGGGPSSTVLDYTSAADHPICNTWMRSRESEESSPYADAHIVLYGPGLTPGTYEVYGYHNTPGGSEPNMPRVYVQTYSGVFDPDILMQNVGAPNDPDGGGVIPEVNDACVPIWHFSSDDDLLAARRSAVRFYTDGSPVKITYEAAEGSTAVLNAFIIWQATTPKTAWGAFPDACEPHACPDTILTWEAGADANTHNVYFDPNLTEEVSIFEDDFESGDANWVPTNWTLYDSNVLADGNNDGNSASFPWSITPGSGSGTLTSVDIDTNEANSMRVSLGIKHTLGTEADDIRLYYFNGSTWDYIADLNSVGPNDVWTTYTDDVNEDEYFISNFKLELRSTITAGEVFIDNVSVTNTWPILAEWLVYSGNEPNWTPPGLLDFDTVYRWRVDEVNDDCAASPWKGFTWAFTTEDGKARDPSPSVGLGSISPAGTTLSWTGSCMATEHKVYFSLSFEEVNESNSVALLGTTFGGDWDIGTGGLESGRRYYWKVKEIGAVTLPEAEVWHFQTLGYPLMHYTFDGVLDANVHDPCDANVATDWTGNVTFDLAGNGELRYGQANPMYNQAGTSAQFTPRGGYGYGGGAAVLLRSCFGSDLLDL
ncbi:MAG: hypothetical protein ACYS21_13190, partial [Planctomycetota bacterium]